MGAPGHPPCTRGTGHSGHPPSLKATAAALWAPRSPPQRQAHYQTSYAAGSNIVCSATGFCLAQWFSQAAARRPPQRIRRAGPARAPWGQCGAVCSFAVSQQWEQWEAPQCVGAGNSHSGRASLGTLCAIVLGLVFTLYSMHLPEKLQK